MQTSLYKISFKDGRVFNIFCKNNKQNKDMLRFLYQNQSDIKRGGQLLLCCGIHEMPTFIKIYNNNKINK